MSYSWYRTGTASVVNGSNVVRFQAAQITTSSTKPVVGDAFILNGSNDIYEVIFIGSDATGEFARLHKAWAGATANNQQYAMMRLASGTQNNKLVAMAAAAINQKQISLDDMYLWYTSTADTVDFTSPDGSTVTLYTYHKLVNEISSVGGNAGNITIVADNIASVNSVAGSMPDVKSVSSNMPSVKSVSDSIAIVKGVNDNMPIVKNVNDNMASVKNVSDNMDTIKSISLGSVTMSQSQFGAIRAANNEEFAASGFIHFGKHYSSGGVGNINQGLWAYPSAGAENTLFLGHNIGAEGVSKSNNPVLNIAGVIYDVFTGSSVQFTESSKVKFPQAPDGKTTYNKSTGAVVTHATSTAAFAAQAADPTNVEVVINRVDMWGFEAWLEEVNTTNPFVYPNGLIQSQATTMDGITTSASARPVTYYAVFDGDTGSKGKGVNFFTLSDSQKNKVLGSHKNNLYYLDDGRLAQWRLRQKTYQGFGNGDWFNIESQKGNLQFKAGLAVNSTLGSAWVTDSQNIGVFKDSSGSLFLVCGTVNRLNSGLYRPSLNANGSAKALGDTLWYNTAQSFTTTADCFNPAILLAGSGSIASGKSGRPSGENQYYDAIYASGFGGVCRDMRYSANGLTPTDFAEADQRVKNGTYRGFELDTRTTTAGATTNGIISIGGSFLVTEIIGATAALNATPSLAGGWQGRKNPLSPTGAISAFPLTRKALAPPTALRSTNNGASWTAFTPTFDAAKNEVALTNEPATNIVVLQYQAFAKQTKPSSNAVVYGGQSGVGRVSCSSYHATDRTSLLCESLIGKVPTDYSVSNAHSSGVVITELRLGNADNEFDKADFGYPRHGVIPLSIPFNGSIAHKSLNYNTAINQQGFINYAYTELKHNGTNWGDDSKVTIVDNQSTKTDLNGNTVLVGTAQLNEPLGWIKNKV
ncbi:MAG: hypothetical protein ACRCVX_02285 [Shewanella sp.]